MQKGCRARCTLSLTREGPGDGALYDALQWHSKSPSGRLRDALDPTEEESEKDERGTTGKTGGKKRRGRRLSSRKNRYDCLAAQLRAVEKDAAIPTADKAQLIARIIRDMNEIDSLDSASGRTGSFASSAAVAGTGIDDLVDPQRRRSEDPSSLEWCHSEIRSYAQREQEKTELWQNASAELRAVRKILAADPEKLRAVALEWRTMFRATLDSIRRLDDLHGDCSAPGCSFCSELRALDDKIGALPPPASLG